MTLFYSVYICPRCGYFIEESSDGNLIYEYEDYIKLQCSRCGRVEITNVTHNPIQKQDRNIQLSKCCHVKMRLWDMGCPSCGQRMVIRILGDDIDK